MRAGLPSRSFQSTGNLSDPRWASSVVTLHKARSQSYGSLQEDDTPKTPPTPRPLRRTPFLISEALVSQDAFVKSYSVLTDDEEDSSVDYYSSDEESGMHHQGNDCVAASSDAMLLTDLAVGGLTFLMSTVVFVSIGDSLFEAIGLKKDAYIGISMCVLPAALLGWLLTLLSHVPWTVPSVDVTFTPILSEMGAALAQALAASDVATGQEELVPTFVAAVCICFAVVGCSLAALGSGKISSLTNLIPAQVVAGFLAGTGIQLIIKAVRMSSGVTVQDDFIHIVKHWKHVMLVVPMACLASLLWAASLEHAPLPPPPSPLSPPIGSKLRKKNSTEEEDHGIEPLPYGDSNGSSSRSGGSSVSSDSIGIKANAIINDTSGDQHLPNDTSSNVSLLFSQGSACCTTAWAQIRTLPRSFAVPALLAISTLLFHAMRLGLVISTQDATEAGWLFEWSAREVEKSSLFWSWTSLVWTGRVRWHIMCQTCWPYWATAAIIGVLKLAIKAGAFSTIFHKEIKADRELILLGVLNVACSALGCSGIHWSFSNTNLAHELGGSQKGGGFVYAACFAILWCTGLAPLQLVPVFVYAALLADVGRTFVDAHLVKPMTVYRRSSDRAVLIVVVAVFVGVDMLTGLAVGVLLSLILLVAQLHAHGTVQVETSGAQARSSLERDAAQDRLLRSHGAETHMMRLQGFLFFATGADMIGCVERRLERGRRGLAPPLRYLVLDMAQVPSMDQTAVRHFEKLRLLTATITTTTNNHSNKKPRLPPPPAPNHSTSAQPLENASTREISRKKEPAATFSVAATTTPADQNSNNSSNIGAAGFAVALCGMTSGVADVVGPHLRGGAFHFFDSLDEALEAGEESILLRHDYNVNIDENSNQSSSQPPDNQASLSSSPLLASSSVLPPMVPAVPEEAMTSSELWRLFLTRHENGRRFSRNTHVGPRNNNSGSNCSSSFDGRSRWQSSSGGAWSEAEQQEEKHSNLLSSKSAARDRLELVAPFLTPLRVVPGEPLFSDEAPADCMYFIVDGRVELTERARTKPLRGSFDAPKSSSGKAQTATFTTTAVVHKVSRGCMVASGDFHLGDGKQRYMATASLNQGPVVALSLRYSDLSSLEATEPLAALEIHKLMGYFLARKNLQSKHQIEQLAGLFASH